MSAWSKVLSAEERAEVEAGIVSAFVDEQTGETRGTSDAKWRFIDFVKTAHAQGRAWADIMLDEWSEVGAGNFAVKLWKKRDAFTTSVDGVKRARALRRGVARRDRSGKRTDYQASLLTWSVQDLRDGIIEEAMREREASINRRTYIALLRLCDRTECDVVQDALTRVGMSLDEYLASEDAA